MRQTSVTPDQRQAARREIVRQVEQGTTASVGRVGSAVPMHRTTIYRLLKRVHNEGEKALTGGRHGHPVKLHGEVLTFVKEHCRAIPLRTAPPTAEDLQTRLAQVEEQIAKKQGKTDRRSASFQALLKERAEVQTQIELQRRIAHV